MNARAWPDVEDAEAVGSRRQLLVVGATVGLFAGYGVALYALEARYAFESFYNRQWFALALLTRAALLPWVPLGGLLGVAVAGVAGILGSYRFGRRAYQRRIWRLMLLTLLAALLSTVGLALAPAFRPTPSGPNILLILLDTARPDRMSLYGYDRETTPHLESLAEQSTIYTQAYSTSSWTPPSHASLFTGLLPCDHGVTQEAGSYPPKLSTKALTLAELLWEAGYRTTAIVGNGILPANGGFSQGFEEYHEVWRLEPSVDQHPSERLLRDVLERESDRPYFVFINLIEPHSPYDSSDEFFGRYDRHPELEHLVHNDWQKHLLERAYSETEHEHLGDLYDSEIQYVDALIGNMLQLLSDHEVLEETMLVITSDHGEHFGEHGLVEHVFNVYDSNVRIPLLIRYPPLFMPGLRDSSLVQLHDLFETIPTVAGVGTRRQAVGVNLLAGVSQDRPVFLEYYEPVHVLPRFGNDPKLERFKRRLQAVRRQDFKLILGSDGSRELYDVVDDPSELYDLSDREEYGDVLTGLTTLIRGQLSGCDGSSDESGPIELDEETLRELRSLGYIP